LSLCSDFANSIPPFLRPGLGCERGLLQLFWPYDTSAADKLLEERKAKEQRRKAAERAARQATSAA
jgi:hypothetical protein